MNSISFPTDSPILSRKEQSAGKSKKYSAYLSSDPIQFRSDWIQKFFRAPRERLILPADFFNQKGKRCFKEELREERHIYIPEQSDGNVFLILDVFKKKSLYVLHKASLFHEPTTNILKNWKYSLKADCINSVGKNFFCFNHGLNRELYSFFKADSGKEIESLAESYALKENQYLLVKFEAEGHFLLLLEDRLIMRSLENQEMTQIPLDKLKDHNYSFLEGRILNEQLLLIYKIEKEATWEDSEDKNYLVHVLSSVKPGPCVQSLITTSYVGSEVEIVWDKEGSKLVLMQYEEKMPVSCLCVDFKNPQPLFIDIPLKEVLCLWKGFTCFGLKLSQDRLIVYGKKNPPDDESTEEIEHYDEEMESVIRANYTPKIHTFDIPSGNKHLSIQLEASSTPLFVVSEQWIVTAKGNAVEIHSLETGQQMGRFDLDDRPEQIFFSASDVETAFLTILLANGEVINYYPKHVK